MTFTVRDYRDMVRLLDQHPEWQVELRRLLLADDFLALPAIVRDLAEAQQRTEARLERLEATVQSLAEAQQRTEVRLEELATDVRALTGEVHRLADWQRGEAGRREGERYERTMVQQAFVWFNGGQGDPPDRPAMRQHLNQILQNLDNLGALTEEQNPLLADLIWRKDEHYAVVEISRHVNGHDITRAARRAATLEAAGVQAIGIVIGQAWVAADTRDQAIDQAVQWRVGDDLSKGYLAFCRRPA